MIIDDDVQEIFFFCKEMEENTTGEDIFQTVDTYPSNINLSWSKCVSICTDGAPAMTGSVIGFVTLAKKRNAKIIVTHCFLHMEAVMAEALAGDLNKLLEEVVKVVNFIKRSSLRSRVFGNICESVGTEYKKLLLHTAIRWLSRGRCLSRFYKLRDEIRTFLIPEETEFHFLGDEIWCTEVAFLADVFEEGNALNTSMQGYCNENVMTSSDKLMAFQEKPGLWERKVREGDRTYPCSKEPLQPQ